MGNIQNMDTGGGGSHFDMTKTSKTTFSTR